MRVVFSQAMVALVQGYSKRRQASGRPGRLGLG